MKIGVISDTHSHIDEKILEHFKECDEIWHAGDIGSIEVINELENIAPVIAVYGNIDDHKMRVSYPENQIFERNGVKVLIRHIAGYPGRYNPKTRKLVEEIKPDIVVAGHSHILKVIYDKRKEHLHINPGAAGKHGFHRIRTLIRFDLNDKIENMQVVEMKR